ncbi:MAG: alpha/beta hydrolase [Selenomonadaceae bacterium]|nr:alpha/beta hydrolase [Selenomonadaceae bacterium]
MKNFSWRKVLLGAAILIAIGGLLVGNYFVTFALKRGSDSDPTAPPAACVNIVDPNRSAADLPNVPHEEWEITSEDGLTLRGTAFLPTEERKESAHRWVIMVHGYGRNQAFVWDYAEAYLGQGYRVLTPDLRAAGKSDGEYLTMGAMESRDLVKWAEKIVATDPEAEISLHGVSMGGATVMMASALDIPHLYAVVEDCGYTGAYEMFAGQLTKLYGLPSFPIMNFVDVVAYLRTGFWVSDMAPIKSVPATKVPMLFIHGDADGLVPYHMMGELFTASGAPHKEEMTVPGAGHADAKDAYPKAYFGRVFTFLAEQAPRENN